MPLPAKLWLFASFHYAGCYTRMFLGKPSLTACFGRQGNLAMIRNSFSWTPRKLTSHQCPCSIAACWRHVRQSPSAMMTVATLSKCFLNEPIFLNPLFKGVCGDRNFMQNFIDAGYTKVKHFRTPFPYKWKPAAEVAVSTGIRSIRVIGRIFSAILRFFKQSKLKWTPQLDSAPSLQHTFPSLLLHFQGFIPFNSIEKRTVYFLCIKALVLERPAEPQAHWKRMLRVTPSTAIQWPVMYKTPIAKRSGDLQWRLAHYILPSNVLSHRICSSNTELCPFCGVTENIFHIFIECPRLAPLFMILSHVLRGLGLVFTHCGFIFGFSISYRCKNECLLANYLSSEAKLAIYLSRKHRMQNTDNTDDDVVHLYKAFVTSRLHLEFQLSDFTVFSQKWFVKESLCELVDGVLTVNL